MIELIIRDPYIMAALAAYAIIAGGIGVYAVLTRHPQSAPTVNTLCGVPCVGPSMADAIRIRARHEQTCHVCKGRLAFQLHEQERSTVSDRPR